MTAVSPGCVSWIHWKLSAQALAAPSCSTTVDWPRSDRMSRMVRRTSMVATGVVILSALLSEMTGDESKCAGCQADRDLAIGMLVVEDAAVEPQGRIGPSERLVESTITKRAALSVRVRTVSSRSTPSPTLIWLVAEPATRSTSSWMTTASPMRARACAWARGCQSQTSPQGQDNRESRYANSLQRPIDSFRKRTGSLAQPT
jgi:hypothetical protein